jgi:RecB family exonuclease
MMLPEAFTFSQGSLQDFMDCRRRFYLRYILQLDWPAAEVEPQAENERMLRQGALFHRLVQQHALGLPAERLEQLIHDPDLLGWWQSYLNLRQSKQGLGSYWQRAQAIYPEVSLTASLAGQRLTAKCDLVLVLDGGQVVILDWKTGKRKARREWLAGRLQTRVYPFMLALAGQQLNGGKPIAPGQIEMVYWFAEAPEQPASFPYSAERFQADQAYLTNLIHEISALQEDDFTLTEEVERCRFCKYRSLCERGSAPGNLEERSSEAEADTEIHIDFDQIAELEF